MFFPFLPTIYKSVLHVLKLVYWAPHNIRKTHWLELNGYEQRPIAALIQLCFEIMINLPGTKLNIFWPSKGEGTQKRQKHQDSPQ